MKRLNDNGKGILVFLFKVAVGVLLLVDPLRFTGTILVAFGILAALYGAIKIIGYFLHSPEDAAKEQGLSKGLLCLAIGLFCSLCSTRILSAVSILTSLYGVGMVVTGIFELQWTVDMLRLKRDGWIPQAISALFALTVGVILLLDPFGTTEMLWSFAGIAMIVSAVPDLLVPFLKKRPAKAVKNETASET